jgi:hypothetical protein
MKNIHILPTDKPSRIRIGNNRNFVIGLTQSATVSKNDSYTNHNIYITSDETIKEVDWVFDLDVKRIVKADSLKVTTSKKSQCWYYKKIILTTDQDLIKDGVQPIDNTFLEWFVKNPSCESVKIESWQTKGEWDLDYKIIIPKEEPKQETIEQSERRYSEEDMFEFSQWISHEDWVYLPSKGYWVNEEQEELEQKLSSKEILNLWFEQFKKK